jgi:hypothetical protein
MPDVRIHGALKRAHRQYGNFPPRSGNPSQSPKLCRLACEAVPRVAPAAVVAAVDLLWLRQCDPSGATKQPGHTRAASVSCERDGYAEQEHLQAGMPPPVDCDHRPQRADDEQCGEPEDDPKTARTPSNHSFEMSARGSSDTPSSSSCDRIEDG